MVAGLPNSSTARGSGALRERVMHGKLHGVAAMHGAATA